MSKGGRPKKQIDYELVDKLCEIQCTSEEVAKGLIERGAGIGLTVYQLACITGLTVGYIQSNYSELIKRNLPDDYMKKRLRRYYKKYPERRRGDKYRERRKEPGYCITCSMRAQLAYHVRNKGVSKGNKTFDMLGYTLDELMEHLEAKFSPGMDWTNYGEKWHIDHRRPVSWFDYKDLEDDGFKECWGLDNLQPMFATDNLSKGNRWEG